MVAKIGQTLNIGARPEHNARTYEFDVAKWRRMWPEATAINVIVQRPGDKTAYPAVSSVDGDTVTWTVTRYDTDRPGAGKMRVAFVNGDKLLGLTPETAIIVQEGLDMASGDTPASDTPPWIQQVLDAIANFTPGEGGTGTDGEDGATFYPSVSEDGELSWTNDKGLKNPEPVNIKGPKGSDANVTQQNIAAALGYTPAKREDVTSLSEEKADKPKPYEVIDSIIVGEGDNVKAYACTKRLKDFNMTVEVPAHTETVAGGIEIYKGNMGMVGYIFAGQIVFTQNVSLVANSAIVNGESVVEYVYSKHSGSASSKVQTRQMFRSPFMTDIDEPYTKISMYANKAFPAGTKITMKGVLADA